MRILILVASFPPILDSAARLYSELAQSLKGKGHQVTVITEHPSAGSPVDRQDRYFAASPDAVARSDLRVIRVSPLEFLGRIPGGKACRFLLSCGLFALRGVLTRRPEIILVYSPPLFMGISAYVIAKLRRSRFVLNMQDIHPKLLFDSGAITNPAVKRVLLAMEATCYEKAHSFIVYSRGNREYLHQRQPTKKIHTIPNWVDTTVPVPAEKLNSFRAEFGLTGKFVLAYGGSMGAIQGLEIVVEAARALTRYDSIAFAIAGQGPSRMDLERLIAVYALTNVCLLPPLGTERYVQLLSIADVGLVTLSKEVPQETVPGKLADLMAKGKPILAAVKGTGDAAAVIREAGCGLCVEPGDAPAFGRAALEFSRNEALRNEMGTKGRAYAERYFSRDVCTTAYESVLASHAVR